MTEPARAMSRADAFAELNSLVSDGVIALEGVSNEDHVNLDGLDPATGQAQAGDVAGVVIRYGDSRYAPDYLDPRNALALVRFCGFLSSTYGVTDLFHLGINGDPSGRRIDCHGQGRAVDFAGVAGDAGSGPYKLTVLGNWGTVATASTPGGDWPAGTGSNTSYRLDGQGTFAEEFFRSAYEFIAGEWQDRSDNPDGADVATTIGERSFIMHPDHPATAPGTPHGREAHKNHIHMQIGKTGTE